MTDFDREAHWERIYQTKEFEGVSWYQKKPKRSLQFVQDANMPKSAKIIDVGGGDSYLVDYLIALGYKNISVLDISSSAILRAKKRLKDKADHVNWIVADASNYQSDIKYDFWHDRAAFHFLTQKEEIRSYVKCLNSNLSADGVAVIATFSDKGPKKCSGIEISQYSKESLTNQFIKYFSKMESLNEDHITPFDTIQNFTYCSFRKR